MATIDYKTRVYGLYSASACGSNEWARDLLARVLTNLATPSTRVSLFYLSQLACILIRADIGADITSNKHLAYALTTFLLPPVSS